MEALNRNVRGGSQSGRKLVVDPSWAQVWRISFLSLQKDVFLFPNGFFYEYISLSLLIYSSKQAAQERETNRSPEQNILLVLRISPSMIY